MSFALNFLHVCFQVLCILLFNGNKTRELIKFRSNTTTLHSHSQVQYRDDGTKNKDHITTDNVKSSRGRSKADENLGGGWVCAVGALKAVYPELDQAEVHFAIGN